MKRWRNLLIALLAIELIGGIILVGWRLSRRRAPEPELVVMDPLTTADLQSLARQAGGTSQWHELAQFYMAAGYFREAEACHRQVAAWNPTDAEHVRQWGFALERCGELSAANDAYARAAHLSAKHVPACEYAIARNCLRQEDLNGAQAALRRCGDAPVARYQLARLLWLEGKLDEAAAMAGEVAKRLPDAQELPRLLYRIALSRGNDSEADRNWDVQERSVGWLPTPLDGDRVRLLEARERFGFPRRHEQARRDAEAGQLEAAGRLLESMVAAKNDASTYEQLAMVAFYSERPGEAADMLESLIREQGPTVVYWELLGDTYHTMHQRNKARAAWTEATKLAFGPAARTAHAKLAESYQETNESASANRHRALESLGNGMVELRSGNLGGAKVALENSVRSDPQLASAWFYLGETMRRQGDSARAKAAYGECLKLQPHYGRAIDRLAALGN